MLPGAPHLQRARHQWAVRHPPGWLEHRSFDPRTVCRGHPEAAHVADDCLDILGAHDLLDAFQGPAARRGWMFMQEVAAGLDLLGVQLADEFHVSDGSPQSSLDLRRVHLREVEFLKDAEPCAHGGSDE